MKNSESNPLNICQVALARDLPIIKENIKEFNKYYSNINFFIICPSKELKIFSKLKSNKILKNLSSGIKDFVRLQRVSCKTQIILK
jgi:hypothetical protein